MKLEIRSIWSPDPDPPSEGVLSDLEEFEVLMHAAVSDVGRPGEEVFGFTICSPSALASATTDRFVSHTLVLDRFSWSRLKQRLLSRLGVCTQKAFVLFRVCRRVVISEF
jgi:hypothetical protein